MIESGLDSPLMTWRAIDWPIVAGDILTRIADHRRDYLDYQGPVSGNRGHVQRVATGDCHVTDSPAMQMVTIQILSPDPLLFVLKEISTGQWQVVEVSE